MFDHIFILSTHIELKIAYVLMQLRVSTENIKMGLSIHNLYKNVAIIYCFFLNL